MERVHRYPFIDQREGEGEGERRARVMPMYFCQRHVLIRGCLQRRGVPVLCALASRQWKTPKERRRIKRFPWRIMNGKPAICYRNPVRLIGVDYRQYRRLSAWEAGWEGKERFCKRKRESEERYLMGYLIPRDSPRKSEEASHHAEQSRHSFDRVG